VKEIFHGLLCDCAPEQLRFLPQCHHQLWEQCELIKVLLMQFVTFM
jgi:hypothetical protein